MNSKLFDIYKFYILSLIDYNNIFFTDNEILNNEYYIT